MVGDLFVKWMKHFVSSTGCNPTNKVILILDGHSSHKSLEALEFAKANGVISRDYWGVLRPPSTGGIFSLRKGVAPTSETLARLR